VPTTHYYPVKKRKYHPGEEKGIKYYHPLKILKFKYVVLNLRILSLVVNLNEKE